MLETTPTLGSCESTLKEKRRFAENSLEFNLKNEIFCELFPDVVTEIKERLSKIKEAQSVTNGGASGGAAAGGKDKRTEVTAAGGADADAGADNQNTSPWHSFTTNIIFVLLFLIFALIVNHVLKTMNIE